MKRIINSLCFLLIVFGVSSCKEVTEVYTNPARTVIVDLATNDWTPYKNGAAYFTTISMPEITSGFHAVGGVLVYMSFDGVYYDALPQVVDNVTYYFASKPGQLEIDIQNNNGVQLAPPGPTVVKIVLVDADQIALLNSKGVNLNDFKAVQKAVSPIEQYKAIH